ncbi:unnamed protein product [Ambrosiozyma monospora]|uniref:Unnamed protein product n=1 Tax=Ambrosiozyma monospora TaxID=43982 RepID=A0A9W6Z4P0_AMBMO|nr:unnamed protein product [Ambrosiozyma monospora]
MVDEKKLEDPSSSNYIYIDADEKNRESSSLGGKHTAIVTTQQISGKSTTNPDDFELVKDKIESMTLEDAKEIISELLEFHKHDINFQDTTYKRMELLLKGHEASGCSPEDYEYEIKSEAAVCKYFSPYPEVRAVTEPFDDPTTPVETFRAHILGYIWAVIGQFINSFFASRFPTITITSPVCQLFLYPCGKLCEKVLPDWGFTFRGTRHSLNPGPWNYKEQIWFQNPVDSINPTYGFGFCWFA